MAAGRILSEPRTGSAAHGMSAANDCRMSANRPLLRTAYWIWPHCKQCLESSSTRYMSPVWHLGQDLSEIIFGVPFNIFVAVASELAPASTRFVNQNTREVPAS